jgi:hypothetical protein
LEVTYQFAECSAAEPSALTFADDFGTASQRNAFSTALTSLLNTLNLNIGPNSNLGIFLQPDGTSLKVFVRVLVDGVNVQDNLQKLIVTKLDVTVPNSACGPTGKKYLMHASHTFGRLCACMSVSVICVCRFESKRVVSPVLFLLQISRLRRRATTTPRVKKFEPARQERTWNTRAP